MKNFKKLNILKLRIIKILFLTILLIPTITKPINYISTLNHFTSKYALAYQSIIRIMYSVYGNFNFLLSTENKSCFKNATEQDVLQVKQVAKELGFSNKEIEKISVKIPKKSSNFNGMYKNNFSSFFNTIIVGRPNTDTLKEALKDPNIKRYLYAHELSHTKYNHGVKKMFSIAATAVAIELLAFTLNKVLNNLVNHPQLTIDNKNNLFITIKPNNFYQNSAKKIIGLLTSMPVKSLLQNVSLSFISRKFEKDADLGSELLGIDTVEGGIKLLETLEKDEKAQEEAVLNKLSSPITKSAVRFLLFIKKLNNSIFFSHPSNATRIKYLKSKLAEMKNKSAEII